MSPKGVNFVPILYQYGKPCGFFDEGEFDTSLTQVIQSTKGLEILSPSNPAMNTGINTGEECAYADQLPAVWVPKTLAAPTGNTDGKATRLHDLAPAAGPSPRSLDSISYLDDSHSKLLDNWFRKIIPCVCLRKRSRSWLPSTPKIKFLMILSPRIFSVLHVISS